MNNTHFNSYKNSSTESTEVTDATESTDIVQSNGATVPQKKRDTEEMKGSDDMSPLSARVKSFQEAVQLSLADGLGEQTLFIFARALKAFEITTGTHLTPKELQHAFSLWWSMAKAQLPPDADFDEWRFAFEDAFARTKTPLGANPLQEALRRADQQAPPPQASKYNSPKIRRLVSVCYHLQQLAGNGPFFLSARSAAKVIGTTAPQALGWLNGLVRDGVLVEVVKGKPGGNRATRFKFNAVGPKAKGEAGNTTKL